MLDFTQMAALLAALSAPSAIDDAFPAVASGGVDPLVPVQIKACPRPIGMEEIEGKTIVCGLVSVPEDHDTPDGKHIGLFFTVLKSHSSVPEPDPVVYLHGGPGAGTLESLEGVAQVFDPFRQTRDVVMWDQRAAGLSSQSVTCFNAINENFLDIALAPDGEVDPDIMSAADGEVDEQLAACLSELEAAEIDIAKYNTVQNARDVPAILNTLGYDSYNLYGISYGTKLTLEVMRSAPEGLRAAVIDGVASPVVKLYDTIATPIDEALVSLANDCAENEACNAAYPELDRVIGEVLGKAAAGELIIDDTKLDVDQIMAPLVTRNQSYRTPSITPYLPAYFYELNNGGPTPTVELLFKNGFVLPVLGEGHVAAAAEKLSDSQQALAESAVSDIVIQQRALRALRDIIHDLKDSVHDETINGPLAALFDQELTEATIPMVKGDRALISTMATDYVSLQTEAPDKQLLRTFVERYFEGATLERLEALISAMSESEVEATFAAISTDSFKYTGEFITGVDLLIYACQEDMPYNSPAGYQEVIDNLAYPELTWVAVSTAAGLYANCDLFEKLPQSGFHEPVTSEVPTLSFGSTWDVQTAQSWAADAVEPLANGQSFLIHEAGHGALIFQKCVGDMAVAFFNDPTRRFDNSCSEATKAKNYHIASWVGAGTDARQEYGDDGMNDQASIVTPEQLGLDPQPVAFSADGTAVIEDRIVKSDARSYVFEAAKGDMIDIAIEASTPSANFNLLHYGNPEAIFSTWGGEQGYKGTLDQDGRYEIRVFLLGQAKETGSADFQLTIKRGAD
ncbi:alpha/beta hydrolase [Martelella radicis]|uniref:Proline iminopeptidase n=1 Tax=Martelella radicis TaxID=1397476 RepID=A0A7W6P7Z3_9HYPH|nr:alpha/beta fold hydrolase [Martelella radicis]MBB4120667.1 pimeloyl-ACP methyl ester carboxylesterase [Martelella radicis]